LFAVMAIEICAVSGYAEFGKNMTAVKVGDEVVLLDCGLHIENYVSYTEDEEFVDVNVMQLIEKNAAPDISEIEDWHDKVKAIVISHVHLDHIGAVPYIADKFDAPIICTPFAAEVLKDILDSEKRRIPNKIQVVQVNGSKNISKNIRIELVNITHSTPESTAIVIHTPEGKVVYMSDFKIDASPTLGKKTNIKRFEEISKEGVAVMIIDSTNARDAGKTPSESVAKEMLRDVMNSLRGKTGILVTTFSSHLARLKSILELGQKMNRKVLFLGRSMSRYITAGEACGIIKFTDRAEVIKYPNQIEKALKKVAREGKEKYLLVVSGHQAEPRSTLSKIVGRTLDYALDPRDYVIFSCRVIPTPTNKSNRALMEKSLAKQGVHIFKDIHQSGHGAREDLKEIIEIVQPKHIIPAHGILEMRVALAEIARSMGYDSAHIHIISDGERTRIV
jgi:ribonuclease J